MVRLKNKTSFRLTKERWLFGSVLLNWIQIRWNGESRSQNTLSHDKYVIGIIRYHAPYFVHDLYNTTQLYGYVNKSYKFFEINLYVYKQTPKGGRNPITNIWIVGLPLARTLFWQKDSDYVPSKGHEICGGSHLILLHSPRISRQWHKRHV